MITLEKARQQAAKITNKDIPISRTLNNWKLKGLLSKTIDYKNEGFSEGNIGLYPDYLPLEIAVNLEMKDKFKMAEIAQARKEFIKKAKPIAKKNTVLMEYDFIIEYEKQENILLKRFIDSTDQEEKEKLRKEREKLKNKKELVQAYLEIWSIKQLKLQLI